MLILLRNSYIFFCFFFFKIRLGLRPKRKNNNSILKSSSDYDEAVENVLKPKAGGVRSM